MKVSAFLAVALLLGCSTLMGAGLLESVAKGTTQTLANVKSALTGKPIAQREPDGQPQPGDALAGEPQIHRLPPIEQTELIEPTVDMDNAEPFVATFQENPLRLASFPRVHKIIDPCVDHRRTVTGQSKPGQAATAIDAPEENRQVLGLLGICAATLGIGTVVFGAYRWIKYQRA